MTRWHETGLHSFFKTSQHKTGAHPFYIGMYIHIYTHIYVHIYTSQKECLCIFYGIHLYTYTIKTSQTFGIYPPTSKLLPSPHSAVDSIADFGRLPFHSLFGTSGHLLPILQPGFERLSILSNPGLFRRSWQ